MIAQPAGVTPASQEIVAPSVPSMRRSALVPRLTAGGGLASLSLGRHPVDDAAIRALTVRRHSGIAVERIGSLLGAMSYLPSDAAVVTSIVRQQIDLAWEQLITSGKVRVESLEVEVGSDWTNTLVRYRNLSTQRQVELRLGDAV